MQHLLSERSPSQLPLVSVGVQPSSFMMHSRVRVCVPSPQVLSHSPKLLQTPNIASSRDKQQQCGTLRFRKISAYAQTIQGLRVRIRH